MQVVTVGCKCKQVDSECTRYHHLEQYAAVVFILPYETVLIESLFSIMNYNKSKSRLRLLDTSVANIIHIKDLEPIIADPSQAFSPEAVLNTKRALEHKLAW